jgi:hypothetical protein
LAQEPTFFMGKCVNEQLLTATKKKRPALKDRLVNVVVQSSACYTNHRIVPIHQR